jgi:hypothetical protein
MPTATAATATATAAIAMGEIDALARRLATADAEIAVAKKESDRLRGLIASRMEFAGVKSHRTVWGLMTLADANSYTYSADIVAADINLKAQKEIERKTGVAEVATSKKSLKVTYSK